MITERTVIDFWFVHMINGVVIAIGDCGRITCTIEEIQGCYCSVCGGPAVEHLTVHISYPCQCFDAGNCCDEHRAMLMGNKDTDWWPLIRLMKESIDS